MASPRPFSRYTSTDFIQTVVGPAMFGRAQRRVVICFFGINTFRPIATVDNPRILTFDMPLELSPAKAEAACQAANDLWSDFLMSRRFGGRTPA